AGLKQLRLVAIMEKGPANCNIWGEPKLIAKDGTVTRLTTLKPVSVSVGWGQLLVNTNWMGHPLIVGDRKFEFGFWLHANSEMTFDLGGKYERFEAFVGEDKDRLGGLVRFRVLSEPPPLPSFWADLTRDFPMQSSWLQSDAGSDGIAGWFGRRETSALEQEIIGTALRQIGPAATPLQAELEALVQAKAPAGDARWLQLYARACRYRDCAPMVQGIAALQKELEDLITSKALADDSRWEALRARAVQAAELNDQFAALEYDLKQREVLSRATGERAWNGTTYVPTERSTAEQIAKETFNRASLVLESDRDPADIVARRTAALLQDVAALLRNAKSSPTTASRSDATTSFDAPLAKL
ncbi:MAG: hypothetical protein FJ388_26255, partial [Verrucomicrobia bacterium]|nr:hypothetical protein [Verrucomicrobiota bacterium]